MKKYLLLLLLLSACLEPVTQINNIRFCRERQENLCMGESELFSQAMQEVFIAIDYSSGRFGEKTVMELSMGDDVLLRDHIEINARSGTLWSIYEAEEPMGSGTYTVKIFTNNELRGESTFNLQ